MGDLVSATFVLTVGTRPDDLDELIDRMEGAVAGSADLVGYDYEVASGEVQLHFASDDVALLVEAVKPYLQELNVTDHPYVETTSLETGLQLTRRVL